MVQQYLLQKPFGDPAENSSYDVKRPHQNACETQGDKDLDYVSSECLPESFIVPIATSGPATGPSYQLQRKKYMPSSLNGQ
jgi:hypothetical protein